MKRRTLLAATAGILPAVLVGEREAMASVPVRIMTCGDSCTSGVNSSDGLGYRSFLQDIMTDHGYDATIVNASAPGMTLDQITPVVNTALATGAPPDIAVWFLGTNDWKWPPNGTLAGWPERYRDEINRVLGFNPNMKAVVATCPRQTGYTQLFTNVNVWVRNNTVAPLAPRAKVVELESLPPSFLTDGVHPGDAGYEVIARLIYRTIRAAGWLPV